MPDQDDTFRRVIEAAQRSAAASERRLQELVLEARRRLDTDPLLAAQVTTAVRVLETATARGLGPGYAELDAVRHFGRLGAALALVIAERPELITGEEPSGAPPVEVVAARIAPLLAPDYSRSISLIRQAASSVLTALALQGWEVTRRADRFASLGRDAHQLRIPTRGRCLTCYVAVERVVRITDGEALVQPWQHTDPAGPHRDDAITAVDAP